MSRIDALQQQALAQGLLERLVIRKRKIEAALARFDSGTFGLCCACQGDVEPERLNADPASVFFRSARQNVNENAGAMLNGRAAACLSVLYFLFSEPTSICAALKAQEACTQVLDGPFFLTS